MVVAIAIAVAAGGPAAAAPTAYDEATTSEFVYFTTPALGSGAADADAGAATGRLRAEATASQPLPVQLTTFPGAGYGFAVANGTVVRKLPAGTLPPGQYRATARLTVPVGADEPTATMADQGPTDCQMTVRPVPEVGLTRCSTAHVVVIVGVAGATELSQEAVDYPLACAGDGPGPGWCAAAAQRRGGVELDGRLFSVDEDDEVSLRVALVSTVVVNGNGAVVLDGRGTARGAVTVDDIVVSPA